jgi:hypothetical protein
LGLRYHLDDARQQRVAANFFGANDKRATLVERSANDRVSSGLGDGHGSAGHHRFIK